jgi:LppX_LprAFG lipoprotein
MRTTTTRSRLLASTVTGSVLALTLVGCGGDADSTTADEEPTASSSSDTPSESTSPEPTESSDDEGTSAAAFLERLKAGMGDEGSMHVEMKMSGPAKMTAQGDSSYGPDGNEMQLSMTMSNLPGGGLEMVLADGKAYMSMPGVTEPGKFFEIDESNPAFGSLDDGLSPADSFAAFDAGLQEVEEIGQEDIDGESVTHYRLTVDAAKALKATGQASVPGVPETLEYDVWLDSEDHMRRLTYELVGTELTMDMTDWGEPVTIEAPSADDLVAPPPGM